ncbi:unnamed protein product [Nippostrongylus brasiliensis]|uniref:Uncharacterized protein n=1 Tax=Nippostrongylus brasiliensis TaxID=27835 RepID=A0A0N4XP78_NIPBR|nr:unnamed protein product [Nippostrongylus brasiliensis]
MRRRVRQPSVRSRLSYGRALWKRQKRMPTCLYSCAITAATRRTR